MKLHMVLEVIHRLDIAQGDMKLFTLEFLLWKGLKRRVMGLAIIERARKWLASRITNLREGDANTRFFHPKVNARRRKNSIHWLQKEAGCATSHDDKAALVNDYFSSIMGTPSPRTRDFNWETINIQRYNLEHLAALFSDDEILRAISLTPSNKAPSPDGYTANFFKSYWEIIRGELVTALNTIHDLRCLNMDLLNSVNIVLIPKKDGADKITDYRPISLIHSVAKLFAKTWHYAWRRQ